MAVAEQITINRYVGNNSTIEFPFSFFCLDNDTLKVFVNGVEQAEDVDYTVAGIGNPSGGTITFAEAPPSAAAVIIFRETPIIRTTDYLDGGAITAGILDYDQDYQTLIIQEIKSRAIYITGEFTVDLQGARIINLGEGINPTDAVTKGYADTILTQTQHFVSIAQTAATQAQAAADIAVPAGVTAQNAANDALISENNAFNSAQQATSAAASATVSAGLAEQFADDAEASAILAQNAALPMTLRGYVDDTGPYGGDCGYETLTTVSTLNIINAVNVMNGGGDCGMFPRWNFVGIGEVDLDTGISLLQPKFTISENGSVVNTSFGIGRIDFVGANVTANTKTAGDGLHTVTVEIAGSVPPGADTEIVFNDGGAYGTDSAFTFNKTTDTLTVGSLVINGGTGQINSAGTIEVDANVVDIAGGQLTLSSANITSLEGHFGAKKIVVSDAGINLVFGAKPLMINGSSGTTGRALVSNGGVAPTWGQVDLISGVAGLLSVSNGGTGASTAAGALAVILPAQSGNQYKALTTNGTSASWNKIQLDLGTQGILPVNQGGTGGDNRSSAINNLLPPQTGYTGQVIRTDGSNVSWATFDSLLPSQTGNAGKILKTNGTVSSWGTLTTADLTAGPSIEPYQVLVRNHLTDAYIGSTLFAEQAVISLRIPDATSSVYGTFTVQTEDVGQPVADTLIRGESRTADDPRRGADVYILGGNVTTAVPIGTHDDPGSVYLRGGRKSTSISPLDVETSGVGSSPGAGGNIILEYSPDGDYVNALKIVGATGEWQIGASKSPGTAGQVLTSNGSGAAPTWQTPTGGGGGGGLSAPNYEEYVATASQTVFNTTMTTTAKAAGKAYLQVFVNGVLQMEGATKKFTVTGANQITFNAGLDLDDDVVIYGYA